jgi:hypothetical protein
MRTRHQDGWVEERGGRVRKWYGHYFEYVTDAEGKETRVHRGIYLGEKAKLNKWEAEKKLRDAIAATQKQQPFGNALTFEWFTRKRFIPMKCPSGRGQLGAQTWSLWNITFYPRSALSHWLR